MKWYMLFVVNSPLVKSQYIRLKFPCLETFVKKRVLMVPVARKMQMPFKSVRQTNLMRPHLYQYRVFLLASRLVDTESIKGVYELTKLTYNHPNRS